MTELEPRVLSPWRLLPLLRDCGDLRGSERLSGLARLRSLREAARKAAYREQLELPSRPRSAPLEEEIVNVLREEAFRVDPREKDPQGHLFAFQAQALRLQALLYEG
ncbi:unnamed protein product [Symbiodinium sp. CCMP2592]|nr:unnamed protein product [Symbiodinium sp. CCMP2592]